MKQDMNILLVEDNDLDVAILSRAMKKIGATNTVVRASDGIEALQIMRGEAADIGLPEPYVVLLDINMPRMNGHEFLQEVRATEDMKGTRVFVFTTSDNVKDVGLAHAHNANGYIVKPNSLSELNGILTTLLEFLEICQDPPPTSDHPASEVTV